MAEEVKMEYVRLGNSGLKISKIILGTMSFGSSKWMDWVLDEEQSLQLLEHAYQKGINTWDTADVYSNGKSEEIVGKALKQFNIPRSHVVILTKCFFGVEEEETPLVAHDGAITINDGPWVNRVGLSRKHIFDAVDASVRRLGTYIDVLQIHRLDRETPREEIMRALNDIVESGKVRYIGASSMAAWEFQKLQNIAARNGWHQFISMQNYYNLLAREEEREMVPYCRDAGIGLIPWSPLARGVLSRPRHSNVSSNVPDRSIRQSTDQVTNVLVNDRQTEADHKILDRVEEIAKRKGINMAQTATAWVLSHPGTNPIMGLNSKKRIDEAVASIQVKLSEEEVAYLAEPYLPKGVTEIER